MTGGLENTVGAIRNRFLPADTKRSLLVNIDLLAFFNETHGTHQLINKGKRRGNVCVLRFSRVIALQLAELDGAAPLIKGILHR